MFWCYLAIIYSFNEVRLHTGHPADAALCDADSWFSACREQGAHGAEFWNHFETRASRFGEIYRPIGDESSALEAFHVLRLGEVRAPLPRKVERWLSH